MKIGILVLWVTYSIMFAIGMYGSIDRNMYILFIPLLIIYLLSMILFHKLRQEV